jgi:hypothetical protein
MDANARRQLEDHSRRVTVGAVPSERKPSTVNQWLQLNKWSQNVQKGVNWSGDILITKPPVRTEGEAAGRNSCGGQQNVR